MTVRSQDDGAAGPPMPGNGTVKGEGPVNGPDIGDRPWTIADYGRAAAEDAEATLRQATPVQKIVTGLALLGLVIVGWQWFSRS